LLAFEPLDLTLQDITNEGCPSLSPNQFINSVAEPFRQSNVCRFYVERRSSHSRVVADHKVCSIGTELSGAGYCIFPSFIAISGTAYTDTARFVREFGDLREGGVDVS
jgi:hypothetical protein